MPSMDLRLAARSWSAMTQSAESPLLRSHYTKLPNSPTTPPADRKRRLRDSVAALQDACALAHTTRRMQPLWPTRPRAPTPPAALTFYALRITHYASRLAI
jgi:hypothetical protein